MRAIGQAGESRGKRRPAIQDDTACEGERGKEIGGQKDRIYTVVTGKTFLALLDWFLSSDYCRVGGPSTRVGSSFTRPHYRPTRTRCEQVYTDSCGKLFDWSLPTSEEGGGRGTRRKEGQVREKEEGGHRCSLSQMKTDRRTVDKISI